MKQINFNNGRDNLTPEDLFQIWELVAHRCRERNKRLLDIRLTFDLDLIPYHGILDRLIKTDHGWSYCAGQSYSDEIRTIRNIILNLR
jgi:hypothetical protein